LFYLYVNKIWNLSEIRLLIAYCFLSGNVLAQSCLNIELLDNWQDASLAANSSNVRYNDCWGFVWKDQEYAVAGSTEGTHFFQITDNGHLIEVDTIMARFANSSVIHRDIKIYKNYAYSVCDEGVSSLQIIDFSNLPLSVTKVADLGGDFGRVHNLFIDSVRALLFACIITPEIGGALQSTLPMRVYSLADPLNPLLLYTGPSDIPEVHDAFVRGEMAYLNCGFDGLRVYDFTNPSAPLFRQNLSIYQDQGYNHQGWMTPDGSTYVFGDETSGKRLKKCTVGADKLLTIDKLFGSNYQNESVAHNVMLSNQFAFVAYYNEGLRIFDLRSSVPEEIAYYDTYPQTSPFNMNGAWGVYSDLPSGRILVSDRHNGLFLFDFKRSIFLHPTNELSIYPNPVAFGSSLLVRAPKEATSFQIQLTDFNGKLVYEGAFLDQQYAEVPIRLARGTYLLSLSYVNYLGDMIKQTERVLVQ